MSVKAYAVAVGLLVLPLLAGCGPSDPAERLLEARMKFEAAQVRYEIARIDNGMNLSELRREAEILGAEYSYLKNEADAETQMMAEVRYVQVFPWGGYESAEALMDSVEDIVRDADARVSEAERVAREAVEEASDLRAQLQEVRRLPTRLESDVQRLTVENGSLKREIGRLRGQVDRSQQEFDELLKVKPAAALCELDPQWIFSNRVKQIRDEICP